MITTTVTCDCGCGAVRGESNHWWLVRIGGAFFVEPWDDAHAMLSRHAAGAECVQKMLSKWME